MHATVWMPIAGDGAIEDGVVLPIEGFHKQATRCVSERTANISIVFASLPIRCENYLRSSDRNHIFVRLWVLKVELKKEKSRLHSSAEMLYLLYGGYNPVLLR